LRNNEFKVESLEPAFQSVPVVE